MKPEIITEGPRVGPESSDVVASLAAAGVEHLGAIDLHIQTGTGERVVRVEPGVHAYGSPPDETPSADAKPGIEPSKGHHWRMPVQRVARRRPVAGRCRPAVRSVGPDPLRGVPHPVPSLRPLRLVAPGALRGRPAAARGGHAVAARPPGQQPAGPGHPPRPHRRPQRPAGGGPGRRPGGAHRAGRGARPAQPPHVVDPRRRGPGGGTHRGRRPTTPPATTPDGWSAGGTPASSPRPPSAPS